MTARLGPGAQFAGYRIEALVGRGGMGVVYRATDLSLDRPVALKLIAPELVHDLRFRAQFLAEPRLAASLDHASVVPIYEAGEHDGQLYLAMRFVAGSDLRTLLQRDGPLAPERALAILGQIAGALDAAHRHGLVHRDVKPANILLDEDEHAYLTDFGLTKPVTDERDESTSGTLDYLAPEQIRGEPIDGRTDEYALACVLFECLAGTPPFRRPTPAETLWAHLQEQPPPLDGHPALDPVLQRGTAQDPDDRYASCGELIEAARAGVAPSPRRYGLLLAAGGVLSAVALVAALVGGPHGEQGAAAQAPPGDGIAAIPASSGQSTAFVKTVEAPSNIAVGDGAVWFLSGDNRTIARLDPKTRDVTRRVRIDGHATDLAAGAGAVWLGTGGGYGGNWTDTVQRIDPATGATTDAVQLPGAATGGDRIDLNGGFPQIAVGAGAVWATGGGAVARIDPRSGALLATVDGHASRIAAGREGVWYISARDAGAVTSIDPRTNRTGQVVRIGDAGLAGIAVGGGSVWVTAEREGFVWRITTGAKTAVVPIEVGAGVNYIAYGAGAVWAANYVKGTLARIDPRTNSVEDETPVGATRALAAGSGSAWVSTAGAPRAGTLPASVCHDETPGVRPDLLIASDLPLQGNAGADPRAMADAIRVVLDEHGHRAGKYTVGYRSCDDSTRQAGAYEPRRCASNANAYTTAEGLVAVIGPYNSGCAQVQLPILNRAPGGPLAVISPTNSVVGLTRAGTPPPFGDRGAPEIYYPTGIRHYTRLASPEPLMGAAHAMLAKQLGLRRVFMLGDGGVYFKTGLVDPFRQMARRVGVGIAGFATYDPDGKRFGALIARVAHSGADGVLLSGDPADGTLKLLKGLRDRLGTGVPVMVGYTFASVPTSELFHAVGPGMRGVYAASLDVPRGALPMTAAARQLPPTVDVDRSGVLEAAQAAELVLSAIAASDGTRASVLSNLRATKVRDGILGTFSFDEQGDMTPGWVPIVRFTRPGDGTAAHLSDADVVRVVQLPPSVID